jgi:hypothetical protein
MLRTVPLSIIRSGSLYTQQRYMSYKFAVGTVLRKVFGPKRDEVTEEWRKLHNDELNDLYSSPNIVRVLKLR